MPTCVLRTVFLYHSMQCFRTVVEDDIHGIPDRFVLVRVCGLGPPLCRNCSRLISEFTIPRRSDADRSLSLLNALVSDLSESHPERDRERDGMLPLLLLG
ncbi:hypothetical protein M9X92_006613 [Pyricularia oryzae]|nr:hypothetical protein M9X92_006613 [Pyricularia oryzae]